MLQHKFLPRLLYASVTYLMTSDHQELPVGLLSRLVLADQKFVEQFSQSVKEAKVRNYHIYSMWSVRYMSNYTIY